MAEQDHRVTSGYSGTPLRKKLGVKEGFKAALIGVPDSLDAAVYAGVERQEWGSQNTDFAHIFTTKRAEIEARLKTIRTALKTAGMVWVSWPKKASKVPSEVTEDVVREVALPMGFVDVKVCAVDAVWSGLKLVIRKDLRGQK